MVRIRLKICENDESKLLLKVVVQWVWIKLKAVFSKKKTSISPQELEAEAQQAQARKTAVLSSSRQKSMTLPKNQSLNFVDLSNLQTVQVNVEEENLEKRKMDKVQEDEEALLKWSARLDFDEYIQEWGRIGTSLDTQGRELWKV